MPTDGQDLWTSRFSSTKRDGGPGLLPGLTGAGVGSAREQGSGRRLSEGKMADSVTRQRARAERLPLAGSTTTKDGGRFIREAGV